MGTILNRWISTSALNHCLLENCFERKLLCKKKKKKITESTANIAFSKMQNIVKWKVLDPLSFHEVYWVYGAHPKGLESKLDTVLLQETERRQEEETTGFANMETWETVNVLYFQPTNSSNILLMEQQWEVLYSQF